VALSVEDSMTDSAALPDLLDVAEELPPELVPWEAYEQQVASAWRKLLASPEAAIEANLHHFLERHPCMLPGFRSMTGHSGHYPYPGAVITEPKLPGLSTRRPDFCWIATDSVTITPVLIEIEAPQKRWFVQDGPAAESSTVISSKRGDSLSAGKRGSPNQRTGWRFSETTTF
jgi:hypothetical protein